MAVFCGAHGRANGLDAVLNAAAILKKERRADIKFVFVGDGQCKSALKQRALDEGLDNSLFLDQMPKSELARLIGRCHLGLMLLADVDAFQYGTSPNKFFDYIASGLPVLCNYPGWVGDMLRTWNCGITVPPGNAQMFARSLKSFADVREALPALSVNARELAVAEFDRDILFSRLEEVLLSAHNKQE